MSQVVDGCSVPGVGDISSRPIIDSPDSGRELLDAVICTARDGVNG